MCAQKIVELNIEKLAVGGDGLAFLEGLAVFVPNVLPGETVVAALEEKETSGRRDWASARLVRVVGASPDRVEPPCLLFGECGGCSLQHMAYTRQTAEKASILRDCLSRTGGMDPPEISVTPSVPYAYRNRMQFHLSPAGRIGLMRRGTASVVETPTCPVASRLIREWMETKAGRGRAREELRSYIEEGNRFLVFASDRAGDDAGARVYLEGRDGEAEVRVAGRLVRFHVKGFFQSNLHALDALVPAVSEGLEGERAADLYCGVGLFGSFLGDRFSEVVCVEHNPFALEYARRNVGSRGSYHALAVEDWVRSPAARGAFDAVVLDPPRTGLAPAVREWLGLRRIASVSYVSCDPATLARDLKDLTARGYRVETIRVYDFFPQTSHVETHVRLRFD